MHNVNATPPVSSPPPRVGRCLSRRRAAVFAAQLRTAHGRTRESALRYPDMSDQTAGADRLRSRWHAAYEAEGVAYGRRRGTAQP